MNSPGSFYTNPVVDADFPDPCLIKISGQGYFAYATHDAFSPTINNIQLRHSFDLINWTESEGALLKPPLWAKESQRFWSPHIAKAGEEYRLYYAAEPDTKDGMCLALATSRGPTGFTDSGTPISRKPGSTFEMIDPCFFVDPVSKRQLLYYGSAHEPIRVVELAADGITFVSSPKEVLYPANEKYHRLREGAYMTYNALYNRYFLWVSGDDTWAAGGYALSVYWATDPCGMFERIPGECIILQSNEHWDSPGHNCIIVDEAGTEWLMSHAVDTADRFIPGTDRVLRKLCMDRIIYSNEGWPTVKNGSPSFEPQLAPVC